MKTNKLYSALTLATVGVTLALSNSSVFAATTKSTTPSPVTQQLKVSPLRTDLTVSPGTSGVVKTYLTNLTGTPIVVQPIENDFVAGDESGSPALILNNNSYAPSHSLKRLMVPLQNITVPANSTEPVNVTIKVPSAAQAGGYFGAIRFSPTVANATGSTAVNLGSSVASLILMTVPGPTTEQLTLTNFDIEQNGSTATNFRNSKDLSLFVRFTNKGNLQEAPFGQVYVQKGKKVVYTYDFNLATPRGDILPDSARRWTIPIKGLGNFGKYTIGATFTYGSKNESIDITKTVWIIPTAYILGAVILVAALLLLGGGSYLFLRAYKRRILKSSRRRY